MNSETIGFSLLLPDCLWTPKNFSMGSCFILQLSKHVTPGMVKMNFAKPQNEDTVVRNVKP